MYKYAFISAFEVNCWITSRATVRRESRCIVWYCYVKLRRVLPSLNCWVSRLSQWFMDNLVPSIRMSNVIVLAMLKAIKMNGVSCCVIGNDERSSRSEMDGCWGMLRISHACSWPLNTRIGLMHWARKIMCCFLLSSCGALCGWWWRLCAGFYIPQGAN